MFKKFTHAAVGTLGVGSLMLVGMAPASAGLPYHLKESYDTVSCNSHGSTEYCHATAGKWSGQSNPAGRGLNKDKQEGTFTTTVDGEVVMERQFTKKETTTWDVPRPHTYHVVEKGTITTPEGTCRYHSVHHAANSEARASHYKTKCD